MSAENPTSTTAEGQKAEHGIEAVETRHEAFQKMADTFKWRLLERFGPNGTEEEMPFHNLAHGEGVANGAVAFLKEIQKIAPELVSGEDIELAYALGLGHDLVQKAKLEDGKKRMRHRGFGEHNKEALLEMGASIGNEEATAEEIWAEMQKYKKPDGSPLFPEKEFKARVFEAIGATYPDLLKTFVEDLPSGGLEVKGKHRGVVEELPNTFKKAIKFFQPELKPKSSLIALAIAEADLRGVCGAVSNPEVFQNQGDAEFYELQSHAIAKEVRAWSEGRQDITPARRAEIGREILNWIKSQVGFVLWQRELFKQTLEENLIINAHKKENEEMLKETPHRAIPKDERAEKIKAALHAQYSHFDENALAAYERHDRVSEYKSAVEGGELDEETFKNILKENHYLKQLLK